MDADVEEVLGLVPLDDALADRRLRRGAHRRLFREMVHGELEASSLTWLRRRALVKFAARLEIDRFEAELLIRGVEYEEAMIPPAAAAFSPSMSDVDETTPRAMAAIYRSIVILILIAMNCALLRLGGVLPF